MAEQSVRWWRRWSLLAPLGVLLVAAVLQGFDVFREVPKPKAPHLAAAVPDWVPGWRAREVPLGMTESVKNAVVKTLNYDDIVYREYTRGGVVVGVYAAYWGAGKMPTRLVVSHTPDRCWTENGWTCDEMRFRQNVGLAGKLWQPVEWRRFIPPDRGLPTYVYYWHLVDGRVLDQGARFNAIPHPLYWWRDAVAQALRGSREQYFIRVTSNVPIERFWEDPGFAKVLRGLESLGLGAEPAPQAAAVP